MKKLFSLLWEYLKKSDTLLLVLCVVSTIYGIVMIRSATAYSGGGTPVRTQILSLFMGIAAYFLISLIDADIFGAHWFLLYLSGLVLLGLLLFAEAEGGNRAWLRFWGIGIQPAEIVKLFFILILARLITRFSEKKKLDNILSLLALGFIFASYFGLIIVLSSDLGSALVYLFILVVMLFAGGLRLYWFLIAATALTVSAPYLWNHFLRQDHRNRIIALFDPQSVDPTGRGITWQVNQSRAAIASGGLFGRGLGQGLMTQSGAIPRQRTDFIFTVTAEELGVVGCAVILLLLIAIIVRCVMVGMRSRSRLGALICVGVAAMLTFQTFENIGMCLGVAPVIGLTLPFFSSGGSSVVTSFAAMGLVSGVKMKPKPTMFSRY
ncbi:MAG: FtsW/RodA/SpoVE family cell cycle protein [bacterium]